MDITQEGVQKYLDTYQEEPGVARLNGEGYNAAKIFGLIDTEDKWEALNEKRLALIDRKFGDGKPLSEDEVKEEEIYNTIAGIYIGCKFPHDFSRVEKALAELRSIKPDHILATRIDASPFFRG